MLPRGRHLLYSILAELPHNQSIGRATDGSAYSRSSPARPSLTLTSWIGLERAFGEVEQGVDPALLVKGRYTLTRDLFRGGQRTMEYLTVITRKQTRQCGITASEFSFVKLLKEIVESQTLNQTIGRRC